MSEQSNFNFLRHGETTTGGGQFVSFVCPSGSKEEVKEFLKKKVASINIPTTGQVLISHGGYGKYTRYEVIQRKYAGGGIGYVEVLEIKNPPDERCGFVLNEYTSNRGGVFTEWNSLENACSAFDKYFSITREEFDNLSGLKRRVECGALTPWFYAIGEERLVGDYTFPEGLQDDPVYRFGRQFVVFDDKGVPSVKTCMGTLIIVKKRDYYPHNEERYRVVHWNDGTLWNEYYDTRKTPRPLEDGEVWVVQAMEEFKKLLAGDSKEFTINFIDGSKFVGKFVEEKKDTYSPEGDYFLSVKLEGNNKIKEGWVYGFKPTIENPNIIDKVTKKFAERGQKPEYIEVKKSKIKKGGKKWSGAFYSRSKFE